MTNSSGNKALRCGTKKILCNMIKFCDREAENDELIVLLAHSIKRLCQIADVSITMARKIRRETGDELNPEFVSPKLRAKKDVFEKKV